MDWEQSLEKLSSASLLVSTPAQSLLRFYCPINAICTTTIAGIPAGQPVQIEGIYQESEGELLYLIDGLQLPHRNFKLTD